MLNVHMYVRADRYFSNPVPRLRKFNYSANSSDIAAFSIARHAPRKMANVMHHAEEKRNFNGR